jgi:hypothetical protein
MKYNYLFCVLLLFNFISIPATAQQTKTIEDEYAAYFTLPREALYLHVNKTTFIKGEEIWFKGYAYDQKNQLTSKATTNIHVGMYDAEGNQVKNVLFKATNGFAKGNILIDSTYTSGTYYLKAATNWMKNFKEDNTFVQKIVILSEEASAKTPQEKEEKYDIQFLPEGGYMINNVVNTIGFKIVNQEGKGVLANGTIYDNNQKEITSFKGNNFGLGKFVFYPENGQQYTAKIQLTSGKTITQSLPKAKAKGINITVNNPFPDKVILNFKTNQATLAANPTQQYKVLIHQNGKQKTIAFAFENAPEKVISILKKDLFKGINTITVFANDNTPILERLFFNDFFEKTSQLNVSTVNIANDSIMLSLSDFGLKENANISISVLPESTKSYKPDHNIISNFYLKPHLRGTIENPQYYFKNMDRKKKYELDILLLTQGWSRYEWQNIFEDKPNGLKGFESGITISGTVNRPKSGVDRLFLYGTKNHTSRFIDVDKNQKFTLTNFFLEEGEEIRFSYMTKKGLFKKPSLYLQFKVDKGDDKITAEMLEKATSIASTAVSFQIPENFFYENSEQLEAVIIKADKKEEDRDRILVNEKVTQITPTEVQRFLYITDLIENRGYQVIETPGRVSITTRRQPVASPVIFFDGARLTSFNILSGFSTANVEKIVIDKSGLGEGLGAGFGGVIRIFSRRTPLFKAGDREKMYAGTVAPFAFTPAKEYYAPKYTSYLNSTFEKYGAISWLPEVQLTNAQPTTFKIYDTRTKNITLFIEGISESGTLISEKKIIKVR